MALSGPLHAAIATYSVALDTDSNTATGCTVDGAGGPVAGIEQIVTTVVDTGASGANITRLERQVCTSGALGAPAPYDAGGWPTGTGNGVGGATVVETSVPLSLLPAGAKMRATALSTGGGGQDATSAFAIALAPPVIGPGGPVTPVPLSPWMVLPLALGMVLVAAWLRRRYPQQTGLFVLVVAFAASGLVWAATVIRDGNVGDWAGASAAVMDPRGDAPANADLVAVFFQQDGTHLYLRFDADIRVDATNQAPQVNAGNAQTITLPALAALAGTASDDGLPSPPGALTTTWSKLSGPGTVTFGNANALATTAAISAAGTYVLRLTASDSALSATADVTITVNPAITPPPINVAPTVNAGAAQTITLPAQAALAGTASDDGLPNPPATLTIAWTKVSGPGAVTFADANALTTTATFATAGTYVLRLTASDSALSATADVTITVNPAITPPPANAAPTANAGNAQTITLPALAALAGTASDDGQPNPPGALTTTWSKLSGPGTVTFGNANALATTAAFSAAGTYVLRLTASDSALSATADVTITVNPAITPPPVNAAPTVNAGNAQAITLPAPAFLVGTASDDGRPNPPGALTTTWSSLSGPGIITFGNANALATTAAFSAAGTYVLRLTASDSALSASADVTITVNPPITPPPPNAGPTVNAGSAQTITLPAQAAIAGSASDDGRPNPPGVLTTTWSKLSGPGTVAFGNANALATSASFSLAGTYVLRLTASDSALSATSDVTITVIDAAVDVPPQIAPIADRTIVAGNRLQVVIQANDANGDPLTYSLPTAPTGAALRPAPLIDWVPSAAQVGPHAFTAQVADAGGHSATASFTVTVTAAANTPPVLGAQENQTLAIGASFTRALSAVDPDAGDTLTLMLVSGPPGMTLSGAMLNWSTSARAAGDYTVTVRVTDAAGAFDQKSFIVTLQASAAPFAANDAYTVKPGGTLAVAAPGVLGNDTNPGGGSLTAQKLTDPSKGVLSAFGADGSFTFVAPASVPAGISLKASALWGAILYDSTGYAASADLNRDGGADVVLLSFGTPMAIDGKTGAKLWTGWDTSATSLGRSCRMYLFGTDFALGDVDGSGSILYVAGTNCDGIYTAGVSNRLIGVDTDPAHAVSGAAAVRWVSERLDVQVPLPPSVGAPPVPTYVMSPAGDGLTNYATPTLAKLTPGGGVKVLTRILIVGTQFPYDSDGDGTRDKNAGCMAATGNFADQGKSCTVTFIVDAVTGVKEAVLTAPNPNNQYEAAEREPLRQSAPVVADLDGDGQVEIISGTDVFKYNGTTWSLAWQAALPGVDAFYEPLSVSVADVDGDGKAEVILQANWYANSAYRRGFLTYSSDGVLLHRFELPIWDVGLPSIADVDGDGVSEILFAARGILWAYHPDGTLAWATLVPDDDLASQPDDDPAVAHWPKPIGERTGAGAGLQVYDLDLDGISEVIVAATHRLVIYDGRTGKLRSSVHNNAFSRNHVLPLVVDANGDGHADILSAAGNPGICTGCPGTNTLAFSGVDRNWAPAPLAQNQVSFNPWAVSGGGTISYDGAVHRSFRTQRQLGTVVDPRTLDTATFTYAAVGAGGTSAPATVSVQVMPVNSPPVITSTPPTALHVVAQPGGGYPTFVYQIAATDPDVGDTIRYELVYSSVNTAYFPQATVDAVTGAMRMFTGPCGGGGCDFGPMPFIVAAVDSTGARTEQGFVVNVTTQSRTVPAVVGLDVDAAKAAVAAVQLVARVDEVFASQPAGTVVGQDPVPGTTVARSATVLLMVSKGPQPVRMPYVVGKTLTVASQELAGLGFTVDATTSPSTTVPAGTVMTQSPAFGTMVVPLPANPAVLSVSSGAPLGAAIAQIVVEPGMATRVIGDRLAYQATAILADGTARNVTLAATWSSSLPATATLGTPGNVYAAHAGTTSISATLNGVMGASTLTVVAPISEGVAPLALIATPSDGQSVTGPVTVTGTATDDNLLRYELAFAADGDDKFATIAEGTTPVVGGALGGFDPTVLWNGVYTLQLKVYDRGGNVTTARTSVTVEGNRKIGAFSLAYTDLTVPLAGMPIQIVRTYDSRNKAKGDFGIGWTLGLKAIRVASTRAPGEGWEVYKNGVNYVLDARANRYLTVTLPSGRLETFDLRITPSTSPLVPFQTVKASVASRPGNLGTLEILSNTDLLIADPQPGPVTLIDDGTLKAFEPDRFRYRQRDGTEFIVTRSRGVESVKDANGNAITVTPGGISHSSGVAVAFARDAEDRITTITDPVGNRRTYTYSGDGDLATATDRTNATTKWFYDRFHGIVRIEDPLGRVGTRTEYDAAGRVISITDANGHTTRYRHDLAGRQEQIEDALGRVTIHTYDDRGNVTATTNALGHTTTATYDDRDRLTRSTDPLGGVQTFAWDDQDNLTRVTDPLGRSRSMAYDASGNLLTETDALGRTSQFSYNAANNLNATTDTAGRATTFAVDTVGNVTGIVQPGGMTAAMQYELSGRRASATDGMGRPTSFSYDVAGNLTRQLSPDGAVAAMSYDAEGRIVGTTQGTRSDATAYDAAGAIASVTTATGRTLGVRSDDAGRITGFVDGSGGALLGQTYDAVGNVTSTVDAAGVRTDYQYDAGNRLVATTSASGAVERRAYDAAGRVIQITDARGFVRRFEWDAGGRLLSSTDALGGVTRHEYDDAGNEIAITDPLGRTTRFDYDDIDRLIKVTYADGTTERQQYDGAGNPASRVDANGTETRFAYDAMRRMVGVADAQGGSLSHTYTGAMGLPARSTDARGAATLRTYDAQGRLLTTTFPDGGVESNTYDGIGNLVSRRNGAGETTYWRYDADGRVDLLTLADGTTQAFTYTSDGRRASVIDGRGTTTFSYDAMARVSRITEPSGAYVRYQYDTAGLRTRVAHGDGVGPERVLDYVHDALGRPVQMTDSQLGISRQSFDAAGNLVSVTFPNGVVATRTYDVRNRVQSLTHRNAGGSVLARETYVRNAAGDVTRVDREDGSRVDYEYDTLRRVTGEIVYAAGGSLVARLAYAYDAAGNRTRAGDAGAPATFVYDAAGRLLSGAGIDYDYDAAGRRIGARWLDGSVPRTARYRWNSRDRLVGFDDGSGGTWNYAYEADGLRVRKSGADGDTSFVLDREHPGGFAQILRATRTGHSQTYDWMDGLGTIREDGVAMAPLADALGSVRALTAASGGVTDTFDYDAWGRPTLRTGNAAALHRFAGEPFDPESQLAYLRARYYDPRTGAFLSRDPLPAPLDSTQAANAYLYALANPVNRRDPSGRETVAELSLTQSIGNTLSKAREAINTRRALARTWDTATDVWRIAGGYMAIQTVANSIATGGRSATPWFGIGGVARLALEAFATNLGEGANAAVSTLATAALAKTAFDMLGGRNVEIQVQGYGVLLAGSLQEATRIRANAAAADSECARGDLAYASRTSATISLCKSALGMPQMPDVSTLTTPNRASLPGILLHEYVHLALNTRDVRYSCNPEGARFILKQLGLNDLRALGNPDSYRCWVESTQVGALAAP